MVKSPTTFPKTLPVKDAAAYTCAGLARELNEDVVLLQYWPDGKALLAVVIDGMGSYGGGEVAAGIVSKVFNGLVTVPLPRTRADRYDLLLNAFYEADSAIRRCSNVSYPEMGATVAAAIITSGELLHLYAGDSRIYLIRSGEVIYESRDHSVVQVLMDSGVVARDGSRFHPMRSIVTSCLGGPISSNRLTVDPQMDSANPRAFHELLNGDQIVLCSDGLHAEIGPASLEAAFRYNFIADRGSNDLARKCIDMAYAAGASDNVSVIVVDAAGARLSRSTGVLQLGIGDGSHTDTA